MLQPSTPGFTGPHLTQGATPIQKLNRAVRRVTGPERVKCNEALQHEDDQQSQGELQGRGGQRIERWWIWDRAMGGLHVFHRGPHVARMSCCASSNVSRPAPT